MSASENWLAARVYSKGYPRARGIFVWEYLEMCLVMILIIIIKLMELGNT